MQFLKPPIEPLKKSMVNKFPWCFMVISMLLLLRIFIIRRMCFITAIISREKVCLFTNCSVRMTGISWAICMQMEYGLAMLALYYCPPRKEAGGSKILCKTNCKHLKKTTHFSPLKKSLNISIM